MREIAGEEGEWGIPASILDRSKPSTPSQGPHARHGAGAYTVTGLMPALEGQQREYRMRHFSEEFDESIRDQLSASLSMAQDDDPRG